MSFTQDELQAFNTILEQKLALHRQELELSLDLRMNMLRSEFRQCLTSVEQELLSTISSRLSEQQNELNASINQNLGVYRADVSEESQQRDAGIVEIQAEISSEDLTHVIGDVVGDRLSLLEESIQAMVKNTEQYLLAQIRRSHNDLVQMGPNHASNMPADTGFAVQDLFTSMEQLEQIVASMQVVMTANHTLLSKRLYQHQHQPLEQAHPFIHSSSDKSGSYGND